MTAASPLRFAPVALVLAACAREPAADPAASAPAPLPVIEIVGMDYAFTAPDTLPAGQMLIRLRNDGTELHHAALVRLSAGKTVDDLLRAYHAGEPTPWAVEIGGPNTPPPGGGVSEGIVSLEPGQYALICVIPSPDGVPHVAKGMTRSITVVPAAVAATPPPADVVVRLSDYDFEVSPALTAGRHVLQVEVAGDQWHEIVIVRLAPGKTVQEVAQWMEKPEGPPPATPVGGTTALAPGQVNLVPVELEAGDYGLICFLPDRKDGKPHLVHGMMKQIKVS